MVLSKAPARFVLALALWTVQQTLAQVCVVPPVPPAVWTWSTLPYPATSNPTTSPTPEAIFTVQEVVETATPSSKPTLKPTSKPTSQPTVCYKHMDAIEVQYYGPYRPSQLPVKVTSQNGGAVSFQVYQYWKNASISWISVEYMDTTGTMVCPKKATVAPGLMNSFTAKCDSSGYTNATLYIHDGSFSDLSNISIPAYCSPSVDDGKKEFFKYKVPCSSGCYDSYTSRAPTLPPFPVPTSKPTRNPTMSPTRNPTMSPTRNPTMSPTRNPTMSPTRMPTMSPTMSPTRNPTMSPTRNPTMSPTINPTRNPTMSPTRNPTMSPTRMPTMSPTRMPTMSPTRNPTMSPTRNPTMSPTMSPTRMPTMSPTRNPTMSPTRMPTMSPTMSPTRMPTMSPTRNPTMSPTRNPTMSPTRNPTMSPTRMPTMSPTSMPTSMPTSKPSNKPTSKPTIQPTICHKHMDAVEIQYYGHYRPSQLPVKVTSQNGGTVSFQVYQYWKTTSISWISVEYMDATGTMVCPKKETVAPGLMNSFTAKCDSSGYTNATLYIHDGSFSDLNNISIPAYCSPSADDGKKEFFKYKVPCSSGCYSSLTTRAPTLPPFPVPTSKPTRNPTMSPTRMPTMSPTMSPTRMPTMSPTRNPTMSPTRMPTMSPTRNPTMSPTRNPTMTPTRNPTMSPTRNPTMSPTRNPTMSPTRSPTRMPTRMPTMSPTRNPTMSPTRMPTMSPTRNPTMSPTRNPTMSPTRKPTMSPTRSPTRKPTMSPTRKPTMSPTRKPTMSPTRKPTAKPTFKPTSRCGDGVVEGSEMCESHSSCVGDEICSNCQCVPPPCPCGQKTETIEGDGKVTGGGWIYLTEKTYYNAALICNNGDSACNAYGNTNMGISLNQTKANYGFNAMWRNGLPRGSTNFDFNGGLFHFHSTTGNTPYKFLEVMPDGIHARWMGTGTLSTKLNPRTNDWKKGYCFMVAVQDHGEPGADDTWRLRIWDCKLGVANNVNPLDWTVADFAKRGDIFNYLVFDTNYVPNSTTTLQTVYNSYIPKFPLPNVFQATDPGLYRFNGTNVGELSANGGGNIQIHLKGKSNNALNVFIENNGVCQCENTVFEGDGNGFVTGGGWVYLSQTAYLKEVAPCTDQSCEVPVQSIKANFGFNAKFISGVPRGSTNFNIDGKFFHFHTATGGQPEYDGLEVTCADTPYGKPANGVYARWTGIGKVARTAGQPADSSSDWKFGHRFYVAVQDNGEPGMADTWRIRILDLDGTTVLFDTDRPVDADAGNAVWKTDPVLCCPSCNNANSDPCRSTTWLPSFLGDGLGEDYQPGGGNIQVHCKGGPT